MAKTVFQLHGVDLTGKLVWRREVRRAQLMKIVAQLEPCLIGIEACGGANYWARRFAEFGHQVKMMSPQFVKPYRKSDKNDRNDAEAPAAVSNDCLVSPNVATSTCANCWCMELAQSRHARSVHRDRQIDGSMNCASAAANRVATWRKRTRRRESPGPSWPKVRCIERLPQRWTQALPSQRRQSWV